VRRVPPSGPGKLCRLLCSCTPCRCIRRCVWCGLASGCMSKWGRCDSPAPCRFIIPTLKPKARPVALALYAAWPDLRMAIAHAYSNSLHAGRIAVPDNEAKEIAAPYTLAAPTPESTKGLTGLLDSIVSFTARNVSSARVAGSSRELRKNFA